MDKVRELVEELSNHPDAREAARILRNRLDPLLEAAEAVTKAQRGQFAKSIERLEIELRGWLKQAEKL